MEEVIERLYSHLEQHGVKGRVVSIQRLQELQREIESRHAQGFFDEEFYQERLTFYAFTTPDDFLTATSLIVVAVPRPQTKVNFTWNGRTLSLILPPTYVDNGRILHQIGDLLAELLAPEGYHVTLAKLPLKPLAVRSGLGEYGRNNICYVPEMGSFLQLVSFYSDLPCQEDHWREPAMMDKCQNCHVCLHKCPTHAITYERFVIHAERCIVFHNERPADYSFPHWLDMASHDCLLGCMYCQRFCPENKMFLGWFEGNEEFSHEETSLLLEGTSPDKLPVTAMEKLKRLELLDSLDILPRNLGVFFKAADRTINQ